VKDHQIAPLLTPILSQLDLELEAVEVIPAGKRRLVRIVVDGDGPEGRGPLLDDIATATQAISDALDGSDVTGVSAYTLEVSSRGVSRPLTLPRHWRRNTGRLVAAATVTGEALTGRIISTTDEAAVLDVNGIERVLGFDAVAKAMIQVELNRKTESDEED
jgi:ribosome maturation factor RimP